MSKLELTVASLLQSELEKRRETNKRYSMRAFARDLNISAGYLSHVLKEQKALGPDLAAILSKRLHWSAEESRFFVNLSRHKSSRSEIGRAMIEKDLRAQKKLRLHFDRLKADQFALIADWHHLAMLELTEVEGFSANSYWIARRLGLSVTDAMLAWDRLTRLRLVEVKPDGKTLRKKNAYVADAPVQALRKFHLQQLKNAERSIEQDAFETRRATGITLAVDPEQLPRAFEMINDFKLELSRHFKKGKKRKVYHLAVQLFPLDKGEK